MKHICMRVTFIVFLGIFALIAGLTYYFGCEDGLRQDCVKYYVIRAPVTNYTITNHTCRACNATARQCRRLCSGKSGCRTVCSNVCVQYRYFSCYDSAAVLHYVNDPITGDCLLPAARNNLDPADAEAIAQREFPLGIIRTIYVNKDTRDCSLEVDETRLVHVAIAFFVLLCLTFLLWIVVELWLWKSSYGSTQTPSREVRW